MASILRGCGLDVVGRGVVEPPLSFADIPPVDLLILDWDFVSQNRGAVFSRPLSGQFDGRIILVLEPEDDFTTKDFIAIDVEGLLLSSASIQDVTSCIQSVCRGSRWIDPRVRFLLGHGGHPSPHWHDLSDREHEVAHLAATGLSNKKIARTLKLSDGTVKTHMHHILGKLRLNSRFELMQSLNEQRIAHPTEDGRPKAAYPAPGSWKWSSTPRQNRTAI